MLSCPSLDRQKMTSKDRELTPNEISQAIDSSDTYSGSFSENVNLSRHDVPSDSDVYWEMNYHEAAIYLEVS